MSTIEPGSERTPDRRAVGAALVALVPSVSLLALALLSRPGRRPEASRASTEHDGPHTAQPSDHPLPTVAN